MTDPVWSYSGPEGTLALGSAGAGRLWIRVNESDDRLELPVGTARMIGLAVHAAAFPSEAELPARVVTMLGTVAAVLTEAPRLIDRDTLGELIRLSDEIAALAQELHSAG